MKKVWDAFPHPKKSGDGIHMRSHSTDPLLFNSIQNFFLHNWIFSGNFERAFTMRWKIWEATNGNRKEKVL